MHPIEIRVDWNNDGDFSDAGESGNTVPGAGGPPVTFTSTITYTWSGSNPDTRSLPAQYTDNISAPVVVPGLTFTVVENTGGGACGAPWTNPTAITGTFGAPLGYTPPGRINPEMDFGAYRTGALNVPAPGTNAGIVTQNIVNSATPSYEIIRVYMLGATTGAGFASVPMTNAPGTFGNNAATIRTAHQIEVDSTHRVFVARLAPGQLYGTTPGPSTIYPNATAGFVWFQTDGGSAPVTDAGMTTVPTANPIAAMAVGAGDDLYVIDTQHFLRKYVRAANYAEATAPFPIDLKAAPYNFGLGSVYVHDFDVSLYNQALYILAETSGGVERLYRIECDGSFTNPIPGTTNPNPVNFQAYTFNTLGRPCDLTIDQWTTAGALLGAASDVQIIVTGFDGDSVTGTGSHGQHIFTTRLQRTASSSSGSSIYRSTINVGTNHLCGRQGSLADPIRHMPPPAGWQ